MKKTKASIFSIIMAMIMMFSSVNVFASNNTEIIRDDVMIAYQATNDNFEVVEEILELEGSVFHFIKTDDHIFTSQLTPYGIVSFAFRSTENTIVYSGEIELYEMAQIIEADNDTNLFLTDLIENKPSEIMRRRTATTSISLLSETIIDNLDILVTDVEAFEVTYVEDAPQMFEPATGFIPFNAQRAPYTSISDLLRNEFPAPYTGRSLGSAIHHRGNLSATVRLTENYTLSHRRTISFTATSGTAISVIGTRLGLNVSTIVGVASFAVGALGVLHTIITSTFYVYLAEENWTRVGRVDAAPGINMYWAGRTRSWNMLRGHLGFDIDRSRIVSDSSHWDFNDISGLMRTTSNNYFMSVHGLF
jgi:hypothetical protein